jgi:two-component system chemotaxis response regulator CheY
LTAAPFEKLRFLIVDDNVHVLDLVKTMLRGLGAPQVFDARTPAQALEHLRGGEIDIVILDYMLGETDGVEFLRRLRSDPKSPAPFVPVIMLTSHTERRRVEAARDAGANAFCTKPVKAAEILSKVAMIVDRQQNFVKSSSYVGPDRRRRDDRPKGSERRRS